MAILKSDIYMEKSTILNGEITITGKIESNSLYYLLYFGYITKTNEPCIIKQYLKDPQSTIEILRELTIFQKVKLDSIPPILKGPINEEDGVFYVFPFFNGNFVKDFIKSTSSLNVIEIKNILIELFKIIPEIERNNIVLTKIPRFSILYTPTIAKAYFYDFTNNAALIPTNEKNNNDLRRQQMIAISKFIEKTITWITDYNISDDENDIENNRWLNDDEKELLSFYITLKTKPSQVYSHSFLNSKSPIPISEALELLSDEHLL